MSSPVETYHGYDIHIFSFDFVRDRFGYTMIFTIKREGKETNVPCFISVEELRDAGKFITKPTISGRVGNASPTKQNAESVLLEKGLQHLHKLIDSGQFGKTQEEYKIKL